MRKRVFLPAFLFFVTAAIMFSRGIITGVLLYQEKSSPCRLICPAAETVQEDMDLIMTLRGVSDCTALYEISAEVSVNELVGMFQILGVDSSYISEQLKSGAMYADDTAMPTMVMNEAALKAFSTTAGQSVKDAGEPDWFQSIVQINIGDDTTAVSGICGILRDGTEEGVPCVYISAAAARSLILQSKGIPEPSLLWIELENAGYISNVTETLAMIGYTVQDADPGKLSEWNDKEWQIKLCITSGIIALLAGVMGEHQMHKSGER